jgi:hypothetical protein
MPKGSVVLRMTGTHCDALTLNGVDIRHSVAAMRVESDPGGARVTLELARGIDIDAVLMEAEIETTPAPTSED